MIRYFLKERKKNKVSLGRTKVMGAGGVIF